MSRLECFLKHWPSSKPISLLQLPVASSAPLWVSVFLSFSSSLLLSSYHHPILAGRCIQFVSKFSFCSATIQKGDKSLWITVITKILFPFQIQLIIHFKLPLVFEITAHDKTLPGGCGKNIKAWEIIPFTFICFFSFWLMVSHSLYNC